VKCETNKLLLVIVVGNVYIKGFVYSPHLTQQLHILVDLNVLCCSACEINVIDRMFGNVINKRQLFDFRPSVMLGSYQLKCAAVHFKKLAGIGRVGGGNSYRSIKPVH
jgi:hypothetical protein